MCYNMSYVQRIIYVIGTVFITYSHFFNDVDDNAYLKVMRLLLKSL